MPPGEFTDVRMKGFGERAAVSEVLAVLQGRTAPQSSQWHSVGQAAGHVLAKLIASSIDVPAFARAAMDGYAVHAADTSPALPLTVIGEAMPGRPFPGVVATRQAVRIATGAPFPTGADALLQAEFARLESDGEHVTAAQAVPVGKHIVRVGEDVPKGQTVLHAGRRLRPQDVALLASIGVAEVCVHRRPSVAILVTGNELRSPGATPDGYHIVDSNSPMLAAFIERDGGECLPVKYLPDNYATVRAGILAAIEVADVVLVSGGTSVGTEDHAPRVAAELGELAFHGIAIRPAGPMGIAFMPVPGSAITDHTRSHIVTFLLPGNPVSCLCAYDLIAGRVVRRLSGRSWELPYPTRRVQAGAKLPSALGRTDYVRVRLEDGKAVPLATGGASNLSGAVAADGFVLIEPERESIEPGEHVEVSLYDLP